MAEYRTDAAELVPVAPPTDCDSAVPPSVRKLNCSMTRLSMTVGVELYV